MKEGLPARLSKRLAIERPTVLGALVMGVVGAVLCFLPGLDAPNYHAAFVLALVGSWVAGPIGIAAARRAVLRDDPARRRPFRAALQMALPAALIPLGLLLLNGARVRQCDVWGGVAFMVVGPVFSTLWSALFGAAIGLWQPRLRRAVPLFFLAFLVWAAMDVVHILRHPAIFAYNPFAGFFSGAIYDAVIEIDGRLALYRLNNLAQIALVIAVARLAWDRGAGRLSRAAASQASGRRWVAAVACGAVVLGFWAARGAIGYEVGRADVQARLGGRLEDERIVLWYDRATIPEAEARALLEDHRFRLAQLEASLGTRFPDVITSYVYGSPEQKRLLMGAGQVYIAKPWLEEIHLNRVPYAAPVIRHELAHVVLGVFADPPLEIPTTCFIPQMALVEGAAEAFEWDTGQLSPHEWSAAMRTAKQAVDLRTLLGAGGFYGQSSDKAYTLAGSFIRWVIDRYGMAAFATLYRDGDFEAGTHTSLDDLVGAWEHFLDGLQVPDDAAGLATGRFNVNAIHKRPCGLDVARVEAEAQRRSRAGDSDGARAAYEQVVAWIPEDAQKRMPLLTLAAQRGDLAAVRRAWADYKAVPGNRNGVSDAAATELVADTLGRVALATRTRPGGAGWDAALVDEARALYESLATVPQPEERRRNVLVKGLVTREPRYLDTVWPYLLDGKTSTVETAFQAMPDDPLVTYLVGRRRHSDGKHADAVPLLEKAADGLARMRGEGTEWAAWVAREAVRLLAHSRWQLGQYEAARAAFQRVAAMTPYGGDRDRYLDWAARCTWKLEGIIR
ncbi:MAG: hypothetical protein JNJ59_15900 [Deltaproteobacteria bacterium]|nr:hypothetical protein [Deltaproteobacteria bacterium]